MRTVLGARRGGMWRLHAALAVVVTLAIAANAVRPVVLWHGMGDSCCNPMSLGRLQKFIEQELPGVYVHSIRLGNSDSQDAENSFFMPVNDQIESVCQQLAADPQLQGGFNAVGFSQGGQFLRAFVQRCNVPAVHNLISVGGQHQGVFGLPRCPGESSALCEEARKLLQAGPYLSIVQNHLVQAQYWQDPFRQAEYLQRCVFLPDINNAGTDKNPQYVQRLQSLNKFVLVQFLNDTMVQPRESEWFGFYAENSDQTVVPLQQSTLYKEDWLGLRAMDDAGKLVFLATEGEHLQFTEAWFNSTIVQPYLNN